MTTKFLFFLYELKKLILTTITNTKLKKKRHFFSTLMNIVIIQTYLDTDREKEKNNAWK